MDRKNLPHPLRYSAHLIPQQIRKSPSSIFQTISYQERILFSGPNTLLKPSTYSKYLSWGFPDHSLRILTYDQDRLLSTHEDLHCGNQIQCTGVSHDGKILVTGGEDGVVSVWRFTKGGVRLERSLSAHTAKITCIHVCQPYSIIVTGSEDATVILWDMTGLVFVKQLPEFPSVITAVNVNELTGEILTASGVVLGVWSINGDCLAVVNASQLPSDVILSVAAATFSDWQEINWYVTGHQSGAVKVWKMVHCTEDENLPSTDGGLKLRGKLPEYRLVLHKALKYHKHPVTALHVTNGLKRQLLSGDSGGNLISWTLPDGSFR